MAATDHDRKVAALLRQAHHPNTSATEAEAFRAKASELMLKHGAGPQTTAQVIAKARQTLAEAGITSLADLKRKVRQAERQPKPRKQRPPAMTHEEKLAWRRAYREANKDRINANARARRARKKAAAQSES